MYMLAARAGAGAGAGAEAGARGRIEDASTGGAVTRTTARAPDRVLPHV